MRFKGYPEVYPYNSKQKLVYLYKHHYINHKQYLAAFKKLRGLEK